jgi:transcriptional regulator of aromatic amino acid metabolism
MRKPWPYALFLDEINELSPEVQAKLLRVSEQGRFERLGSTRPRQVNVRIIAASNRMIVSKGQILNISIPRSTASNFSTNQYADK